eukprot:Gb_01917 [translate_table: standard]
MAMAGITKRRPLIAVTGIMVVICAVGLMAHGVAAQSSSGCSSPILSLTPCLNFITGSTNGASTNPSKQCCDAVATVANTGVACLCQLITTSNPFGFVNRTLAISLPGLCKIKTEPLNKCEETAGVPFTAPAASPGSSPALSPEGELTPSAGVSAPATSKAESPAPTTAPAPVGIPVGPSADSPAIESSPAPAFNGGSQGNPLSRGVDGSGSYRVAAVFETLIMGVVSGLILANNLW